MSLERSSSSSAATVSSSSQYTYSSSASTSSQYTYSNGTYFPAQIHLQQQPPPPYIGAAPPPVQLPYPSVYPAIAATTGVYNLPQFQQAQQLFHRDAQTITPEALENVKAALASSETEHRVKAKKKGVPRKAAGKCWKDPTLAQWPLNDYRLFCGDLGNEVNEDVLSKAFSKFPSFNMAKVLRDKWTGKTRGFGFVSFSSPLDFAAALKGMNEIEKPYFSRVAMSTVPSMSVAGQSWEDPTPSEWPENDYCLLCGNLGNEVNDDVLTKVFSRIPTFNKAKVVRNKQTGKTRGYGFVSFSNSLDRAAALTEMNGKYVGNRPIILRKSKSRTDYEALERRRASA